MAYTQAEVDAIIEALIIDNNTNQVTPDRVRKVCKAINSRVPTGDASIVTATEPLYFDPFTNNFNISKANSETDGFLSKEDWLFFYEGSGTVTSVTGTDGVVVSNGTTTPAISLGNITPDSVSAVGTVTGSNLSGTNTGDNSPNSNANAYADSKVQDSISDGTIDKAPSQNAVFDALELKANANQVVFSKLMSINSAITGTTAEVFVASILIPANTMAVGHRMEIKMALSKLGAVSNNFNPAIYISPTGGGISGEKIMTGRISVTNKFSVNSRNLEIKSGAIRALNFTTAIENDEVMLGTANFQTTATAINFAIDNYLNITSICTLSTETSTIEYVSVNIFR